MPKRDIGQQYDEIAQWWAEHHEGGSYGVAALERALSFAKSDGTALDVGCGAGGRLMGRIEDKGFAVTGVDASAKMIALARAKHPNANLVKANIEEWEIGVKFDFIMAWDCLFHLPLDQQEPVLSKLCGWLTEGGILIYSFGDAVGAHSDSWRGQTFHYSSLGVTRNLEILHENGMALRHLELDQFPQKHVHVIAQKG